MLANVSTELAQGVAERPRHRRAGGRSRACSRTRPTPEVTTSPALSLMARPGDGSVKTRRVALLVADGIDGASLRAVHAALAAAGAVPRFVGARLGRVRPASGDPIHVEVTMETAPSVLWDGVVVPGGDARPRRRSARRSSSSRTSTATARRSSSSAPKSALVERAMLPAALPDGSDDPGLADGTIGRCRQRLHRRPRAPSPLRARNRSAARLTPRAPPMPLAAAPAARAARGRAREARAAPARPVQQEDAGRGHRHRRRHHGADRLRGLQRAERREEDPAEDRAPLLDRGPAVPARHGRAARPAGARAATATASSSTATGSFRRCSRRSAARKETINFETYIYWSGAIGKEFADALAERARAGVKVHVLLDWVGSQKMEEALVAEMKSAGVEIQKYHPLHWSHLGRLNNRTHRKLLVVDGRIGFTGGVGIADQWTRRRAGPGALARHPLPGRGPGRRADAGRLHGQLDQDHRRGAARRRLLPAARRRCGDGAAQVFSSSPSGGSASMELMYLMSITAAKRTIRLSSSYFVPNELAVADDGRGDASAA